MSTDTSELPVVDRQRAFSKSAVAAEDIANIDTKLKVDNAFRAGSVIDSIKRLSTTHTCQNGSILHCMPVSDMRACSLALGE